MDEAEAQELISKLSYTEQLLHREMLESMISTRSQRKQSGALKGSTEE